MPMTAVPDLVPALPELFLLGVAMALLMLGVFQRSGPKEDVLTTRLITYLAMVGLALAFLLVVTLTGERRLTFGGLFVTDGFAGFAKCLILLGSGLALLIGRDYLELTRIARFEYPVLILFATVGMMMMVSANDLIALYLGLELQSLSLYVVAAFNRDDARSSEAGLKYFMLGALASGMLLYGASLIYGLVGNTGFDAIATALAGLDTLPAGLLVGLAFVVAGLAFKVSAVPFHMWTPDVYEGAPTSVTAFFSIAPKIAALALLSRVMVGPFGPLTPEWQQVVIALSIASMVLGAVAAIGQRNIKRLMAYSSIGHVGYALIGLAVANTVGVRGILIYLAIYLFMNLGAFACILCMRRSGRMVEDIANLGGLSRSQPKVALALAIFMFSMAGLPPLAGFFGKLYIFLAAIDAQLYTLAVIGVLSSVVAAFYYIRIVKVMYFDEAAEPLDRLADRGIGMVMAIAAVLIVTFFAYPAFLLGLAETAAAALFAT